MKFAYLINTYPSPSHSFIRREIQALEQHGLRIHRFAMRADRARLVDPQDLAEDAQTEHVLAHGGSALLGAALRLALRRPAAMRDALVLAWRCGARIEGGARLRHLIYLAEAAWLTRRCAALGLSHLHAHFGTNSATVAMLVRALGGPSYSFTVHGPEEFDHPHALALDEKLTRARFAVAVSQFGRSQLCRWVPHDIWPRLHVIHCGITPERFAEPAAFPDGPTRLISIGRFAEQKGQALLLEALAQARRSQPDLHLTLVGDGPLRAVIEARIAALGLAEHVTMTGWRDEAGVRAELARAHVLVLPSFAEGLPVVIMEAMASGRPVITTWVAGIPELVTPDCGWLVPAGDAGALRDAIVAAANEPPGSLRRRGARGRERALARHDIHDQAARLARLLSG